MNESIHRKSAMALKFKNTKTGLPMGVWWAGLFVALLINLTPSPLPNPHAREFTCKY